MSDTAVAALRAATQGAHDHVDAAFGRFDLTRRAGYRALLTAHARALPAAEARMRALPFAATLEPRLPLLAADLADLGLAMPPPLALGGDEGAAGAWGVLYVVEGSRLGGALLARSVPAGLPARYLNAAHPPGQWRAIRAAIDAADADRAAMLAAALACFDLYARAAALTAPA